MDFSYDPLYRSKRRAQSLMTSDRKRVLFILPSLGAGGAERVKITLLRHLDRSRFEPHLALVEAVGPFLTEVPPDVPIHDLKAIRVRYALPAIFRLVWKLRPHAVVSALAELNVVMGLIKPLLPRGLKLLVEEETSATAELAEKGASTLIWHWLYRHFYAKADKVICVADYVVNDLAVNFRIPREKLTRIYNPVDIDKTRALASEGNDPFRGPGPHLVAAGRLLRVKAFDMLLDAMAMVRKAIPTARLTILGGGPLESDLKSQRERLGLTDAVHFVGFQSNPYPYFKHADLFVLSSRYEGLPLVVLEALAVGTPVVATDCPGGIREILDGCASGRLVPNADSRLLADALVSECQSERGTSPGEENLEEILDKFRIEKVVRDYEQLLSS
jgi:glycosyltransferase involved in cell wall biosynthesis